MIDNLWNDRMPNPHFDRFADFEGGFGGYAALALEILLGTAQRPIGVTDSAGNTFVYREEIVGPYADALAGEAEPEILDVYLGVLGQQAYRTFLPRIMFDVSESALREAERTGEGFMGF